MAGTKESPRQRMIGMMYLVLTALLALNVSREILHAFVIINEGMENSNVHFSEKNKSTMNEFDQQMAIDPLKTKPFFDKAQTVATLSEELHEHIEQMKRYVISKTAGYDSQTPDSLYALRKIESKDNYDIPTSILIGSEPSIPSEAEYSARELRLKMESFSNEVVNLFDAKTDAALIRSIKASISFPNFPRPEGGEESWEIANFYHMPLAACVTNLSKIQADIKNVEADALKALLRSIRLNDFKFDTIQAKVIPQSNYVLLGDDYQADVFLAAYSTTEQPTMLIGKWDAATDGFLADDSLHVEAGLGKLTQKATSVGFKTFDGLIKVKMEDGNNRSFPFQSEYIVAEPSLTVSATKMNVLYKGIENPLSISVPGVASENISVAISGGNTVRKMGNGEYIAVISANSPSSIDVNVTALMPNGETRMIGTSAFRVKQLPRPSAKIGQIETSGRMTNNELVAFQGIRAVYGSDFAFNLPISVSDFKMLTFYRGEPVIQSSNSNKWSETMKTVFQQLRPGTQVTFYDIHASGNDNMRHEINPIVITIQ